MDIPQTEGILSRITYVDKLDAYAPCGLVIEAIIENLEIKQAVFQQVDAIVSQGCILASNTSSLSITALAAACTRPAHFIGIHFFNPAPLMPLVEVAPGLATEPGLAPMIKQLMLDWGKSPVITKDTPGFIVNRVARPFYGEALRILEEGIADVPTIDWAMTELGGFRMGPFTLMDFIGHDVNFAVTQTVFAQFFYDPRYKPSLVQQRLVEAGHLGRKSGKGFYEHAEGAVRPEPKRDEALGQRVLNRIRLMLINEAADALFLQIASRDDIDLAMTRGGQLPQRIACLG